MAGELLRVEGGGQGLGRESGRQPLGVQDGGQDLAGQHDGEGGIADQHARTIEAGHLPGEGEAARCRLECQGERRGSAR